MRDGTVTGGTVDYGPVGVYLVGVYLCVQLFGYIGYGHVSSLVLDTLDTYLPSRVGLDNGRVEALDGGGYRAHALTRAPTHRGRHSNAKL